MSGGISAATIFAAVGAAAAVYGATQAGKKKEPEQAAALAPPEPEKPPQAAKAPDLAAIRKRNMSSALTGQGQGNASTFLTGPSGIDDSMLNLGKSTLLGQ